MPGFYTHWLCAQRALTHIDDTKASVAVARFTAAFNYGAQGPDLLEYLELPKGAGEMTDLAKIVHSKKCGLFFQEMLRYAAYEAEERAVLTGYLLGFASHWAHDATMTAEIHKRAGYGENAYREYEAKLDAALFAQSGWHPSQNSIISMLRIGKWQKKAIGAMVGNALRKVYDADVSDVAVEQCMSQMFLWRFMLQKNKGFRKAVVLNEEKKSVRPGTLTCRICPDTGDQSLIDEKTEALFVRARDQSAAMMRAILSVVRRQATLEDGMFYIGDRSYITGENGTDAL